MPDPADALRTDRALRNAARQLVTADIAYIRDGVANKSVPARLADRLSGGARDIADEAGELAQENRAVLGTGLALGAAGLVAWLLRDRISAGMKRLYSRIHARPEAGEPDPALTRSEPHQDSFSGGTS